MRHNGGVSDRILTRPGAEVAYSVEGSGPIVVSAHGLSASRAAALAAGMSFDGLSQRGHTLVAYDARGHGQSTGRLIPADYTWLNLSGDLLALIDEVSPDTPVDAVGTSMGCATILCSVIAAPERFRRLVLVIPPTAWETRAMVASGYELQAKLIEEKGIEAFLELTASYPNPPAMPAELVTRPDVTDELLPTVFRGAALSDFPSPDAIAGIRQPVLILAWVGDPGHPVSTSEKLVALLPRAELLIAQSPEDVAQWVALAGAFLG
ncbi:alpha/beta hydrolase [soil metagenome]